MYYLTLLTQLINTHHKIHIRATNDKNSNDENDFREESFLSKNTTSFIFHRLKAATTSTAAWSVT